MGSHVPAEGTGAKTEGPRAAWVHGVLHEQTCCILCWGKSTSAELYDGKRISLRTQIDAGAWQPTEPHQKPFN